MLGEFCKPNGADMTKIIGWWWWWWWWWWRGGGVLMTVMVLWCYDGDAAAAAAADDGNLGDDSLETMMVVIVMPPPSWILAVCCLHVLRLQQKLPKMMLGAQVMKGLRARPVSPNRRLIPKKQGLGKVSCNPSIT